MRRIGIRVATALTIAGSIGAASSRAQEVADEVLFAAARDLTGPERGNRIGLDPREVRRDQFPGSGVYVGPRAAERTRALAERLGARVVTRGSTIRCDSARARCTLGDLDVVVALSEPVISGDTAIVNASISWMSGLGEKRGVATRDVVLTLIRSESGWRAVAERLTRITLTFPALYPGKRGQTPLSPRSRMNSAV